MVESRYEERVQEKEKVVVESRKVKWLAVEKENTQVKQQ